jgi:small GTP-binding protein
MIQKKVCMVGVYGTGKTSLVQRFVHSMFSERYLSTVGVKIDRKPLELDGTALTLVLWDLAGRDGQEDITTSYLRGAHAILYVADGTRKETCDQLPELRALVREAAGEVPELLALNKSDSRTAGRSGREREGAGGAWDLLRTSARPDRCREAFQRLGWATSPRRRHGRDGHGGDVGAVDARGLTDVGKAQGERGPVRHPDAAQGGRGAADQPGRRGGVASPRPEGGFVVPTAWAAAGGALASETAVTTLVDYLGQAAACFNRIEPDKEHEILEELEAAVQAAHRRITEAHGGGRGRSVVPGPATTLTMALLVWPRAYIVHVGDSRAFYLRKGRLKQLTRDQTTGEYMVDVGAWTEEQARSAPIGGSLVSALGATEMTPSIGLVDLQSGDSLLLCTDGLTRHVSDERIAELLGRPTDAETACRELVDEALAGGGHDNVTVVLARMGS